MLYVQFSYELTVLQVFSQIRNISVVYCNIITKLNYTVVANISLVFVTILEIIFSVY